MEESFFGSKKGYLLITWRREPFMGGTNQNLGPKQILHLTPKTVL